MEHRGEPLLANGVFDPTKKEVLEVLTLEHLFF